MYFFKFLYEKIYLLKSLIFFFKFQVHLRSEYKNLRDRITFKSLTWTLM